MNNKVIVSKIDSLKSTILLHKKIIDTSFFNIFFNILPNVLLKYKDITVSIDLSNTTIIRNNYVSIIGMAIETLKNKNIDVKLILPEQVDKLEIDIEFIHKYSDCNINTIKERNAKMLKYANIRLNDMNKEIIDFTTYFSKELNTRMNNLSSRLLKKITQKILELFSNVSRHSKSELGLFYSGQFFPDRNRFYFTIADNGVTIKNNVNKFKRKENIFNIFKKLSGKESIKWAMEDNHSTTGEGGGLGLSLLKELIRVSDGTLEIISNDGYYSLTNKKEKYEDINKFNGTIVSICLNTNDDKYFDLQGDR